MNIEIERKFLVRDASWREQASGQESLCQGYLANTGACSIRVRRAPGRGFLSVKGMQAGRARPEFEYAIPEADAMEMLSAFAAGPLVEKIRHLVAVGDHRFEVDEFQGANRGLVIAEIELAAVDEEIPRPPWLGEEVTEDARFYNFRLATAPFTDWDEDARRATLAGRCPPGRPP